MSKRNVQCAIADQAAETTALISSALSSSTFSVTLRQVAAFPQLLPLLQEGSWHLLFTPYPEDQAKEMATLAMLRDHAPDTVLVWLAFGRWQGLSSWVQGVEYCILPLDEPERLSRYLDFLLHYADLKQSFRQCKHLLGIAELRCHWLVDYSYEAIAYIGHGNHLYANQAYLTLFGFDNLAAARATPLLQLVEPAERKAVEALSHAAMQRNHLSERLLVTLRSVNGEKMRAEVRFIAAVFNGKRCLQFYVHPVERHLGQGIPLWRDNPWERQDSGAALREIPTVRALPVTEMLQPSPKLHVTFQQLQPLKDKLPALYMAEAALRQPDGRIIGYTTLLGRLRHVQERFRLGYWLVEQVLSKHPLQPDGQANYLVWVSLDGVVLDDAGKLRQLVELLDGTPEAAKHLVLALPYQQGVGVQPYQTVQTLLRAVGAHLALDVALADPNLLDVLGQVKPTLLRLAPEMLGILQGRDSLRQWHYLIRQAAQAGCRVVVAGVDSQLTFKLVSATAASYRQGSYEPV